MNRLFLGLVFMSFLAFPQQRKSIKDGSDKDSIRIAKMDSVYSKRIQELQTEWEDEKKKNDSIHSNLVRYESSIWKDYTNWITTLFGLMLALVPISIGVIEYKKSKTKEKLLDLKNEIEKAKSSIDDFSKFQTYQELYFEDVLKPTINQITDALIELALEEKLDFQLVDEITDKYYDFERVINLTHSNHEIKKSALEYIENRKSKFLKIKMESLLENDRLSPSNSDLKLMIHKLLEKYKQVE